MDRLEFAIGAVEALRGNKIAFERIIRNWGPTRELVTQLRLTDTSIKAWENFRNASLLIEDPPEVVRPSNGDTQT